MGLIRVHDDLNRALKHATELKVEPASPVVRIALEIVCRAEYLFI
jgi:hypothetical protein